MMGLRKSAAACFALLLPFTAHPSSTLMHLSICGGLPYSFKDVLFHARRRDSCFLFPLCIVTAPLANLLV